MYDIPFNLQLFAEGEAADAAGADSTNAGTEGESEQREQTFTQTEVDRMIEQRLARQRRETDRRVEQARRQARSEGERLAQMSDDERARHDREEAENTLRTRENDLNAREADIARRELRFTAIDTLTEKGLPRSLADVLDYSGAEACSKSIQTVEKAFRDAVKEAVNQQLKSSAVELARGTQQPVEKQKTKGELLVEKVSKERANASSAAREALKKYYL